MMAHPCVGEKCHYCLWVKNSSVAASFAALMGPPTKDDERIAALLCAYTTPLSLLTSKHIPEGWIIMEDAEKYVAMSPSGNVIEIDKVSIHKKPSAIDV